MYSGLDISDNSSNFLNELGFFISETRNNDFDFFIRSEDENSLISSNNVNPSNKNLEIKENKINGENILKKEKKLLQVFSPKLDISGNDNENLKESETEAFFKETKYEKNSINDDTNNTKEKLIKEPIKSKLETKKRIRKKNTDNIRKKIIAKFFKHLIKNINNRLELIGINKKFKFLPAKFINKFISEVLNEENKSKLDFTFGQLISKNIFDFQDKEKLYKDNLKVLNYLRYSNSNIIEKKKFSQIFQEYLVSEEFNDGKIDKKENEQNYINRCKKKAYEFLNFVL